MSFLSLEDDIFGLIHAVGLKFHLENLKKVVNRTLLSYESS